MNIDTTTKTFGYSELSDAVRRSLAMKYAKRLTADESQPDLNSVVRRFCYELSAIGFDINSHSVAFSIAESGEEGATFSGNYSSDVVCQSGLEEHFGKESAKFLNKVSRQFKEVADEETIFVVVKGCNGMEAMPSNMEVSYIASEYDAEAGGMMGVMYGHELHCEVQTRLVEIVNMVARELYRRIMRAYGRGMSRIEREAEEYYRGKRFLINGNVYDEEWDFIG